MFYAFRSPSESPQHLPKEVPRNIQRARRARRARQTTVETDKGSSVVLGSSTLDGPVRAVGLCSCPSF